MGRNGWIYLAMFGIILVSFSILVYHTHNKDYLLRKRIVPPGYYDKKKDEKATVEQNVTVYAKTHVVEEIPTNMTESDDFFSDLFDATGEQRGELPGELNHTTNSSVLTLIPSPPPFTNSTSLIENPTNSSTAQVVQIVHEEKSEVKNIKLLNIPKAQTSPSPPQNKSTERNVTEVLVETQTLVSIQPDKLNS